VAEITLSVDDVEFVKELYPRVREDDAAIERYRAAIDRLPPITVARGRVLVDGFHRWQAYKRERLATIVAEDLGNLTDVEILKESIRRNATHGRQLETSDKKRMADLLYRKGTREHAELSELLSITADKARQYVADARRDEVAAQKADVWDRWLNCEWESYLAAAAALTADGLSITDKTVKSWVSEFCTSVHFSEPPGATADKPWGNVQHFDVWSFTKADGESSYFGKLPPQVAENLLWLYTEPDQIVVDPFAGGGTVIDVAKRMGRRVWASDRKPSTPTLPIHEHDITAGWPDDAPRKADLVILDPPYWQQAAGRYSDDSADLGNMTLDDFYAAWESAAKAVMDHAGRVAYIVSPAECKDENTVVDLAVGMLAPFTDAGWRVERRIIVPYQTQQATGQQVDWARKEKKLLKLYRDLLVMAR
jgi:hypothetical protein